MAGNCASHTAVCWQTWLLEILNTSSFAKSKSKHSGSAELKCADKYSVVGFLVPKHTEYLGSAMEILEEQNFCFEYLRGFKTVLRLLITFHKTHSYFKSLLVAYLY